MKMFVAAIMDVQAQCFLQPMFCQSQGVAIRVFSDEVNRMAQDNVLYQHPQDFRLFQLGEFDNEAGVFHCASPLLIIDGSAVSSRSTGRSM